MNISPEERERRRKRMLELRKKLQERDNDTKKPDKNEIVKPVRPITKRRPKKKAEIVEEITSESEQSSSQSESEEEVVVKQPKPKAKCKQPKTTGKAPVLKKVSIKYYSDVSQQEMDRDKAFLNSMDGLTMTKQKKAPKKQERIEEVPKEIEKEDDVKPPATKPVEQVSNPHADLLKSLGY